LPSHWGGEAAAAASATSADVVAGDGSSDAELPEVLAVLFDSSKQLVVTAGNSGVIRVSTDASCISVVLQPWRWAFSCAWHRYLLC
jgi:hypothetical protein